MNIKLKDQETLYVQNSDTSVDVLELRNKQDLLISGINIKTINSSSLLGSGDILIVTPEYINQYFVRKPDLIYQYESGMPMIYHIL